jgi:Ala-tRNA(Pro) deacylase
MSVSKKLMGFLNGRHIRYDTVKHPIAYTAQEIAASLHVSGSLLAKTVIVRLNGRMAMVVLPASYRIDFNRMKEEFGADIELASESEFNRRFPDCEPGAMPPFGNLYEMPVFVAESLAGKKEIVFNAGSHKDAIRMNYEDFNQLAHPQVIQLSTHC